MHYEIKKINTFFFIKKKKGLTISNVLQKVRVAKAEGRAASVEFRAKSSREANAAANSVTDGRQREKKERKKKNPCDDLLKRHHSYTQTCSFIQVT